MVGATLVMLHPDGILDFNYLSAILERKRITSIGSVATLYNSLVTFIKESTSQNAMKYLRSMISSGK